MLITHLPHLNEYHLKDKCCLIPELIYYVRLDLDNEVVVFPYELKKLNTGGIETSNTD
jgi:hypothetical protein